MATKAAEKQTLFDPKVDVEKFNLITKNTKLISIQLISSSFEIQPSFFTSKSDLNLILNHGIQDVSYVKKESIVTGIFRFELIAKLGRKHALSSKGEFVVFYDLPEGHTENESKAFAARVGLFACYPYFRSLFAHLASIANAEMPILPVLSADPLSKMSGTQRQKFPRERTSKKTTSKARKSKKSASKPTS